MRDTVSDPCCGDLRQTTKTCAHPEAEKPELVFLHSLEVLQHLHGLAGSEPHLWPALLRLILPPAPPTARIVWFHRPQTGTEGAAPGHGG